MLVLINDFNIGYLSTDKLPGDVSGGRAAGLRQLRGAHPPDTDRCSIPIPGLSSGRIAACHLCDP
ncbi:hypothetical protein [Salinibacter ruber]|uniref:hypothetical protein n=1 Tax=Salinibacter ruber TaxID=146919 RepID=UPI0021692FC9|nr:hypothetical protein [Salinibacter ruber]MCS4152316.1 hypothetical protein [Salinibacter ruber]